jgi:hypothetical protein
MFLYDKCYQLIAKTWNHALDEKIGFLTFRPISPNHNLVYFWLRSLAKWRSELFYLERCKTFLENCDNWESLLFFKFQVVLLFLVFQDLTMILRLGSHHQS